MSSKRGRKRNDNLPPNRARDVQRAFRARRAAHLQALEERVSELEEENSCLRQSLGLQPLNRPPLGRGPTGKDKPKTFDPNNLSLGLPSSHDSSSADSPTSHSSEESPSAITVSMSSRPMTVIESNSWDESMLLSHQHQQQQQQQQQSEVAGSLDTSYQLASLSAPLPVKPLQYPSYTNSLPSSSRLLPHDLYTGNPGTSNHHYPHTSDRPMGGNYGSQNIAMRTEIREEPSRQQYSYMQSYQHDAHSQSPSPSIHSHDYSHNPNPNTNLQRDSPLPYPHRRSLTDPQGFSIGQGFPHLPNPAQLQHNPGPSDYIRHQDHVHLATSSRSGVYAHDGRLNPIP
ncbi:hypothetical protein B0H34DRAFT_666093 [Crassisporium funariophilum]|nr:hypothetical protein B0H34DRAFT_666093 [Crassisporium funariophilum]